MPDTQIQRPSRGSAALPVQDTASTAQVQGKLLSPGTAHSLRCAEPASHGLTSHRLRTSATSTSDARARKLRPLRSARVADLVGRSNRVRVVAQRPARLRCADARIHRGPRRRRAEAHQAVSDQPRFEDHRGAFGWTSRLSHDGPADTSVSPFLIRPSSSSSFSPIFLWKSLSRPMSRRTMQPCCLIPSAKVGTRLYRIGPTRQTDKPMQPPMLTKKSTDCSTVD